MTEIKIGGRTVPMALTSYELIAIQEEIGCRIGEIRDKVFGIEVNLEIFCSHRYFHALGISVSDENFVFREVRSDDDKIIIRL